ncbi:MAG: phosphate transport system regulatory protein PhoU [Chloroflexi bacterium RBG_19FT_COMBO_62_14]|nr:MAG: phosphate transport system regulatory protein PhoU [Chloroflexi bacterium RBG_19FT_COMBO_62_14]
MSGQSRGVLDREMHSVQDDLLRLAGMVEQAVEGAVRAMVGLDEVLARQIAADDANVNALRFKIEEACLALIATQQPAAGDLRAIVAAMNIVSDLERMADHAAGIARTVFNIAGPWSLEPLTGFPRMAELTRDMLRRAMRAYVDRDAAKAHKVAEDDDQIDDLYLQVFGELVSVMIEDPAKTSQSLKLLFAAHNLERIGDRITNIAERVVFIASGEMQELNPEPDETRLL